MIRCRIYRSDTDEWWAGCALTWSDDIPPTPSGHPVFTKTAKTAVLLTSQEALNTIRYLEHIHHIQSLIEEPLTVNVKGLPEY